MALIPPIFQSNINPTYTENMWKHYNLSPTPNMDNDTPIDHRSTKGESRLPKPSVTERIDCWSVTSH